MSDPYTADGNTLQASYEHESRVLELDSVPYSGWNELTGGGVAREGQTHVFGAGGHPRGLTNGRAVPQDLTLKLEGYTWQNLKNALILKALAAGDNSDTNYQKVEWQIVDQWRGASPTQPTITTTTTVKVKSEVKETPNDGNQFYYTLTLMPVGIPQETFGT